MLSQAMAAALALAVAFGAWQYVRAERLAGATDRLATCQDVQTLKQGAENETDEDLADSISGGFGGLW